MAEDLKSLMGLSSCSDHLAALSSQWALLQLLGHACQQPCGLPLASRVFSHVMFIYIVFSITGFSLALKSPIGGVVN